MRSFLYAFFSLFLFSSATLGQTSDWQAVVALKPGTRVIVSERGEGEIKGRIRAADDSSIAIERGGKRISVSRSSVDRVYLAKRGSVLKRALIGAAAGAGIGAAIGAGVTVATKGDGLAAAGGFLYGIPVGAAIGAATTGTKRGRLIYSQ
ncbi:MAG: hypothetical protein AB7Q37_10220 [Pyrinomonadaceae bacterium]